LGHPVHGQKLRLDINFFKRLFVHNSLYNENVHRVFKRTGQTDLQSYYCHLTINS